MERLGRVALGSIAGGAVAGAICPLIRPFFQPVGGGVGYLTVHPYPKGWDYAVIALLAVGAFTGGALVAWFAARPAEQRPPVVVSRTRAVWITAVAVFLLMFAIHDRPLDDVDPFHDGEHLTPAFLFRDGARPFGDVFVLHGLGADGGLDALVLGDPPSPRRARRLQTVLDSAALALLVPIAAELTVTVPGLIAGVFLSLCGTAAFILPSFPWFRLLPVLLATLALLRYARGGRACWLLGAFASGTLGLLWSLDTGLYALAGTLSTFVVLRLFRLEARPQPLARVALLASIALAAPFFLLLVVRADISRFLSDSFVVIPSSIDSVWSTPAPSRMTRESVRYYFPPLFYGFMVAAAFLCWRRGERLPAARLLIVGALSLVLFRSAAGRAVSDADGGPYWGAHTRFAVPMLGLAVLGLVVEPIVRSRKRWMILACLVPAFAYFEVARSVNTGWKLLSAWPARQKAPPWHVRYPFRNARTLYTPPENATDLATLAGSVARLGPGPIFDFTNERVLYYLLERRPATRCFDVPMLSVPALRAEAMKQLSENRPVCVILGGEPAVSSFDGLSNRDRVPELAAWIDANYPTRTQIGRFILATP